MTTVFSIFSNVLQFIVGYIFYKIISCCLDRRKPDVLFFVIWTGLSVVSTITILAGDPVNITIVAVLFILINFLLFKGKPLIKLAMAIILFPIATGLNFLHNDMGSFFFFKNHTYADNMEMLLWSVSTYLFVVLFWFCFYRCSRSSLMKMRVLLHDKAWIIVIVICLASFAGIFTCVYFTPAETYKVWPWVIVCIITSSCSIRLASYLADGIYADMEKKNLQLQKSYYEILEENQSNIRKLRHDMNNHMAVIGTLLKNKDTDEALEYFQNLSVNLEASSRTFCKNSVVNAVLNTKYNQLTSLKADIFFNISIDNMSAIDDVSLCTIFANTLDNAIEALRKIGDKTDRHVSLKARYSDTGYFSYEIVNRKVNPIRRQKNRFLTDKADPTSHGIGLSSVQSIVARYGGDMDISYSDAEFKVTILIGEV